MEDSCWSGRIMLLKLICWTGDNFVKHFLVYFDSENLRHSSLCAVEKLKRQGDRYIVPRWHGGDGCIVAMPLRTAHMYSAHDMRWLQCHLLCDCISSFWKCWVLRWFFSISKSTLQCYAEDPWWSIYQKLIAGCIWWGAWLLVIW